jgi:hypothetical protein
MKRWRGDPITRPAALWCVFCFVSLGSLSTRSPIFFTRQAQFIELLKIEPKFRAGSKPVSEPQRGIGRYRSLAVNDTGDSIYWDVNLPCQLSGGNSELFQLFGKMLARMYRGPCHSVS